jgi:murein DD-endopeptidase MepM/ murein hydrolase activator NlpD
MSRRARSLLAGLTLLAVGLVAPAAHAQTVGADEPAPAPTDPVDPPQPAPGPPYDEVVDLTFPVDGAVSFPDTYDAPRGGGTRVHKATDLGGPNAYGLPIHAAVAGKVTWITGLDGTEPHATAGYAIGIEGVDGRRYNYIHLGRQDGPPGEAYAPGIVRNAFVQRGQLIGFLGHSGNASPSWPHLHFEIVDARVTDPYGTNRMNPYPSLVAAKARGDLPLDGRRFLDVPATFSHHAAIIWLADSGITTGCGSRTFCPNVAVNRGQLATFLAKSLGLPEPVSLDHFSDVPANHSHARGIAQLAEHGIARGAADGTYAPNRAVTREQMASLLSTARGLQTASVVDLPFTDVRPRSVHAGAIAALYHHRIALGSGDLFHPTRPVTRAEMAAFLQRSFG